MGLPIRNVVVAGRRTSVRLERVMWDALREIARHQGVALNELVTAIDRHREASSLTAAIRVFIVDFYRSAAGGAADALPVGAARAGLLLGGGETPEA
ncbi:MAG TPA: ribbon-helix-helix domain-containing protein [Stellaceae bacterium]|nr:ribbon-helix-helix domain-containing protein [Stellaceae bacterium]